MIRARKVTALLLQLAAGAAVARAQPWTVELDLAASDSCLTISGLVELETPGSLGLDIRLLPTRGDHPTVPIPAWLELLDEADAPAQLVHELDVELRRFTARNDTVDVRVRIYTDGVPSGTVERRFKSPAPWWRWWNHSWAFCFTVDDGMARTAAEMDSLFLALGARYTAFVNPGKALVGDDPGEPWARANPQVLHAYWQRGATELAHHTYTHASLWNELPRPGGNAGGLISAADTMASNWPQFRAGYRGTLREGHLTDYYFPGAWDQPGYWRDESTNLIARTTLTTREHFLAEVERDSLAAIMAIPLVAVKTLAYPGYSHDRQILTVIEAEGYVGARGGRDADFEAWGDITTPPFDEWGRISLYRVPVWLAMSALVDDHTLSEAAFKDSVAVRIRDRRVRHDGGVYPVITHATNPANGAFYAGQYILPREVRWLCEAVADSGGITVSFGEAMQRYRSLAAGACLTASGDRVYLLPGFTVSGAVPYDIGGPPTGVATQPPAGPVPRPGVRAAAYPNPFNPDTIIELELAAAGRIDVTVFDLRGRRVRDLYRGPVAAGRHRLHWDGRRDDGAPVASGVYVCRAAGTVGTALVKLSLVR